MYIENSHYDHRGVSSTGSRSSHAHRGAIIIIIILLVYMMSIVPLFPSIHCAMCVDIVSEHMEPHLQPHTTIYIDSNADFLQWPGNGTAQDPYRIENLIINSEIDCIIVNGTTDCFVIRDCILNTTSHCILFINVKNGRVEDCRLQSRMNAVVLYNSSTCTISGCHITSGHTGIGLWQSRDCVIHNNIVTRCKYGLSISGGQFNVVTESLFFINEVRAIEINAFDSINNTFFRNAIGWNGRRSITNDDVIDNGMNNAWDNGTIGNEWEAYYLGDTYPIPGTGDAVDRHPVLLSDRVQPIFLETPEQYYLTTIGDRDYRLRWRGYDRFPDTYNILMDGVLVESGNWTGDDEIILQLDGLDIGLYLIKVFLVDAAGNYANNTVSIRVIAPLNPWIVAAASCMSGVMVMVLILNRKTIL